MIKHLLASSVIAFLCFASCTNSSKTNETTDADSTNAATELKGEWELLNVVLNDSVYARPADVAPGIRQYFSFDSIGNFGVSTNCNLLGGSYHASGSSIQFYNIARTEIACDDMTIEELLCQLLPAIERVSIDNDSVARLLTPNPQSYILLLKSRE